MASGKLAFKETDLARALRAAQKVGGPFHVRIEKGTGDILILPGEGHSVQGAGIPPANDDEADLDRELAAWEAAQKA